MHEPVEELRESFQRCAEIVRTSYITVVANAPEFDGSMGFKAVDDAIAWTRSFMEIAEDVAPDEREAAAQRDIAIYRGARILAVVRRGPGGIPEVTRFPDAESN